jgi:hypothetical protein
MEKRGAGAPGWRVAWAELALVTALAGLAALYLVDARSVSLSLNNLLLLQPTAIIVLGLWAVIAFGCIRRRDDAEAEPQRPDWTARIRVVSLVAAFGAFTFSLERIGYDIAIAVFVAVALWIGGERKPLTLVLFSVLFTIAVVLGFRMLVPYPFPTTLL